MNPAAPVATGSEPPGPTASARTWAPLRYRIFMALWIAQLASAIGSFMQNVGAAWLMGDLGGSALAVASIQSATLFPIELLGLPAGALADLFDRRRLLIVTQSGMLAAAATLTALTYADRTTPATLIALTFALGVGVALNMPAWQAIQPDLVPREVVPQAIALGSVSANVGRALGPALGGLAIAAGGPQLVFLLNALSFVGVVVVLIGWRPERKTLTAPRETLTGAIRAGMRYAMYSRSLRAVMARNALFVLPGSAILALLPVLARGPLGVDALGFGVLYGCFGVGAVAGALLLARLRTMASTDGVIATAAIATALSLAALAGIHVASVAAVALVLGGAGWTLGTSMFSVTAMGCLPAWVRARGMALTILVPMGVISVASIGWGALADSTGVTRALGVAAASAALPLLAVLRWKLEPYEQLDMSPVAAWPEPVVIIPPEAGRRLVLVTVTYVVRPEDQDAFLATMRNLEPLRRRTGASRWALWQDAASHNSYIETYEVGSWEEHLRQQQRVTMADQRVTDALAQYYEQATLTHRFISAY